MKATVLLPTTGDRGPILEYSVGSVLNQTITDWELFIIGDGASPETQACAREWAGRDTRIRYFDFPKDESRGEVNRHQVLSNEARGDIVCYLTDRDLYLDHHLELFHAALAEADFAISLFVKVAANGGVKNASYPFAHQPPEERAQRLLAGEVLRCPLSFAGHRLDTYRKLPFGWRTTPNRRGTDVHMWRQFLEQPWVRSVPIDLPTLVYLKRGRHPGLSTEQRIKESKRYFERYITDNGTQTFYQDLQRGCVQQAPARPGIRGLLQRLLGQ
jgi:glycosyltransferase involved in cell wall biosynthesis